MSSGHFKKGVCVRLQVSSSLVVGGFCLEVCDWSCS